MEPPPDCPQETPAKFLNLIGPGELQRCLFTETLDVVAAEAQPGDVAWGQWWVSARWAPYERVGEPVRSCLLVQAGCRRRQDGVPASSSLTAYVTPEMETLEQEEQECLEHRPYPVRRRTHMVRHQHGMTVTKTLQEGEAEPQYWNFIYSRAELQGLLLEGANLLLLRVLACRREVPPGLVFPTINTEGQLCTASYRALGVPPQAEVFVIERAVHGGAGASTAWQSSFLPSGRLARLVQVGSPMVMRLQDEPVPATEKGGVVPQSPFPKQPLDWEEDIQLFSWFLDRKGELQESHTAYIQQHPELQVLLSDFLLALLLQQPEDPTSFAAEFFAPKEPPETPFTSSRAANPSPSPPQPGTNRE
ncbi:ciliogenesis-associated TTC17-interacting protein [Melopsittacus undulatus]|uniref:ciliogenesis-associated TTC17-interacting protein n=1 Tax=Melopsittacus undulatus TaxID=13146 RepID=UPI0003832FDB|nr:ciliogenesis-associated TTC17-interacting protein [Melopsittacus undulatus]